MLRHAEFVASMRAHRVVSHELVRYLFRKRSLEPARNVDRRQFLVLTFGVCLKFRALTCQFGLFGICL